MTRTATILCLCALLACPAMAAQTIYVNTSVDGTGDDGTEAAPYDRLADAISAATKDLSSSGGLLIHVAGTAADTTQGNLTGFSNITATEYITIQSDAPWDGTRAGIATCYHMEVSGGSALTNVPAYTRVSGVAFKGTGSNIDAVYVTDNNAIFDACLFYDSTRDGLRVNSTSTTSQARNCAFLGNGGYGVWVGNGRVFTATHCDFVRNANGMYGESYSTLNLYNCYLALSTTTHFYAKNNLNLYSCATDDGYTGTTQVAYSTAHFANVTAGTEDFHLTSTSSLKSLGQDPSAYTTTDIDGDTRFMGYVGWDVGIDEYEEYLPPTQPSSPIPADASTAGYQPLLRWSDTGGITDTYYLYYRVQGQAWPAAVTISSPTTSYLVPSELTPGETYEWRVDAENENGLTTGATWTFTVFDYPAGSVFVGPSATGSGSGADASNLMAWTTWDDGVTDRSSQTGIIVGMATPISDIAETWPTSTYYARTVTQWGITWTFDREYRIGRYCVGDIWALGPVVITGFNPASTTGVRIMNGAQINPAGGMSTQGHDNAMNYGTYSEALNVALDVTTSNVCDAPVNSSVVSSISDASAEALQQLTRIAVLTVVESVPDEDAFRPPYCGDDKTSYFAESDILWAKVQSLTPPAGTPSLATVAAYIEATWYLTIGASDGWSRHPSLSMPGYFDAGATQLGDAAMILHLDYTQAEKRLVMLRFLQIGIDIYGAVVDGAVYPPNGGHNAGYKWPVLFAGIVFNNTAMRNIGTTIELGVFQEDGQTRYLEQVDVDRTTGQEYTDNKWTYRAETNGTVGISGTITAGNQIVQDTTGAFGTVVGILDTTDNDKERWDWVTIDVDPGSVAFDLTGTYACVDQTVGGFFYPLYRCRWILPANGGSWRPDDGTWRDEEIIAYTAGDIGTAEWAIQCPGYTANRNLNNINGYRGTSYRQIASKNFGAPALSALMTPGGYSLWNRNAFFDYSARWMSLTLTGGDWSELAETGSTFAANMWTTYYTTYEDGTADETPPETPKYLMIRRGS